MNNYDLEIMRLRNKGYAKDKKVLNNKIEFEQIIDLVTAGEVSEEVRGSTFKKLHQLMNSAFRLSSLRQKSISTEMIKE